MEAAHHAVAHAQGVADHRVESAQRKRAKMRSHILQATSQVFSQHGHELLGIEDVVRAADISRGTFYKYFDSLEAALTAACVEANDRMISDILPIYGFLREPWERAAVGFRVYMVRAWKDPAWAAFVARMDAWPRGTKNASCMGGDLLHGQRVGQFHFEDIDVAEDFITGASAGCIKALRAEVPDPHAYIDASVRMLLRSIGCAPDLLKKAVAFSAKHLFEFESGQKQFWS